MLHSTLNELSIISLLRSDRWLEYHLSHSGYTKPDVLNTLALQAVSDYQYYSDTLFRREDVLKALQRNCAKANYDSCSITVLQNLCDSYLQWRGDHFSVKPAMMTSWANLISKIDPAWILAAGYAAKIFRNELTVGQMVCGSAAQCRLASSQEEKEKSFADNHVHLSGHGDTSLAMFDFATRWKPARFDSDSWPHFCECTLYECGARSKDDLPILMRFLCHYLQCALFSFELPLWDVENVNMFTRIPNTVTTLIAHTEATSTSQKLVKSAITSDNSVNHKWLLLLTGLLHFAAYDPKFENSPRHTMDAFQGFIHCSNIFRTAMIVGGVGLGRFVEFFGFKQRKGTQSSEYNKHSLAFDSSDKTYREFKISPEKVKSNWLKKEGKRLLGSEQLEHIHYAVHFARSYSSKASTPDKLEEYKRDKLKKNKREYVKAEVYRLKKVLNSVGLQRYSLEDNEKVTEVNLLSLVRGIDVAGNENDMPIEIFAPGIRSLRSAVSYGFSELIRPMRQMHLTIHAGEDFSHLVSGLRSVDETVCYCSYQEGDRIGHGLALGIDVQQWKERQQDVYVSVQEHLDNLVWCYHYALKVGGHFSKALLAARILEAKIGRWSRHIYDISYTPEQLFDAWELRRNCPFTVNETSLSKHSTEYGQLVPDIDEIECCDETKNLWLKYVYSAQDKVLSNKMHEIVHVTMDNTQKPTSKKEHFDTMSAEELELLTAIQDYLLQQYSEMGVVIEACPTSNVYIGRFKSYEEHPVFRWYPPDMSLLNVGAEYNKYGLRSGPISVCINTDDAGLMPTTIANEHRVLKQAAIDCYKVGTEAATLWIDRLREIGLAAFKRNHLPFIG